MKRAALSLMLSFAVAGSLYAAQNPTPSQQPPSAPPSAPTPSVPSPTPSPSPSASSAAQDSKDVTLTGCLIQGSGPNVYVLENAKMSTASESDKGKSYVVVVTGAADLKPHLNHQVRIVGGESMAAASSSSSSSSSAAGASSASSDKKDESSFPRLNARTVTMVANTCPA
jgi:hypothetical protein